MVKVSKQPVSWQSLTTSQVEHGLHPDELSQLQLPTNDQEVSKVSLQKIQNCLIHSQSTNAERSFKVKLHQFLKNKRLHPSIRRCVQTVINLNIKLSFNYLLGLINNYNLNQEN